jgi:hypothetical protein
MWLIGLSPRGDRPHPGRAGRGGFAAVNGHTIIVRPYTTHRGGRLRAAGAGLTSASRRAETWRVTPSGRDALAMAALAAASGGARLAAAVLRPSWHDEYFTAWAAALPLRELLAALRLDSGPPLPYLLAKLVAAVGIDPLAAARAVSVLAGTLAVLAAAAAARRAWGAAAGWWCGALLAVHPLAVAWSSEGRAYALLLLAAALVWDRLQALRDVRGGALGLAAAAALGCWSHALGLVLAAAAAATAALVLGGRDRTRALLAVAAGLVSHLPWFPVALAQPPGATAWMGGSWAALAWPERVLAPVRLLPPLAPFADHLDLPAVQAAAAAAAALVCLVLLAAVRSPLPAALLAALPPAALGAAAMLGAPYLFPGRSEALCLAPFAGLLAAGATRHRGLRLAAAALVAAGGAMCGGALAGWAAAPPATEARLADAIARALPGGGTIVVGGHWRLGIWRHLGPARGRCELVSAPAAAAAHPGWYDDRERPAAGEFDALAARLAGGGGAVAVVQAPGTATAASLAALARRLGLRPALAAPGAVLWLPPA